AFAVLAIGFHRVALQWRSLLAGLLGIILFIPVDRYTLPVKLPFALGIYRLFVILFALVWVSSLLIDRRVRLRVGLMGAPLIALLAITLFSDVVNPGRVHT